MARRKRMKHVKKNRSFGHRHKHNKKSVAERKRIKNLLKRWKKQGRDDLLNQYFRQQQLGTLGIYEVPITPKGI